MSTGNFPLTSVAALPNVTVAFPGEVWSNRKASGAITPGEAVVPVNSGGKLYVRKAVAGDSASKQVSIAFQPVQVPDANPAGDRGPNEIVNEALATHDYVRCYYSGAFHLTLIVPNTYVPGDLIGWDADGVRPTGKSGTGAWAKDSAADIDSQFEVIEFRTTNQAGTEGILTVRSLRGQF